MTVSVTREVILVVTGGGTLVVVEVEVVVKDTVDEIVLVSVETDCSV